MADLSVSQIDSHIRKCEKVRTKAHSTILTGIIILSIIPMAALSLLTYFITFSRVMESKANESRVIVNNIAEATADLFEDRISLIHAVSHHCSRISDVSQLKNDLELLAEAHPDVESMSITDINGIQVVRSDDNPLLDISDREFFRQIIAGEDLCVSRALISRTSGLPCLVIAKAVKDENSTTKGITTILIRLDNLYHELDKYELDKDTVLYITDNTGQIAYHPDKSYMLNGKSVTWPPVVKAMDVKDSGTAVYINPVDNTKYLSAYAYIPNVQWSVIIDRSYTSVLIEALSLHSTTLVITLIFIVAALILAGIIYKRIEKTMVSTQIEGEYMAKALLEEQNKYLFYAKITHELRTPLNIILGAIQVLELDMKNKPEASGALKRAVRIMKQNCLRLLRLVSNFIDISKIDTGFERLNLINVDVISFIEDMTMSVSDYLANKDISLVFDTDTEELLTACDPDKLERIVLNLLSNSAKFTPAGGSIKVQVQAFTKTFRVSVSDTGCGIPAGDLDRVFDRFWQNEELSRKNPTSGSGIGLSLAKSFVELHGGTIWAESQEGKGTTVAFELPIKLVEEPKAMQGQAGKYDQYVEKIQIELSDIYQL
ncbi:MAG TPA: sensor histidine kinase [Candidatus Atribacteria bacterium]|nr:sensor histidine kinase [Candidatus Atribacteria bacterium]